MVFIGSHPDDIVAVAGTFLLLRQKGFAIHNFCLSHGEKGSSDPNIGALRSAEEQKVSELLGADLKFFDQPDGAIYAGREVCSAIALELAKIRPVAVFTAWPFDKPDHTAAYTITHKALHLADLYWTTEFYMTQVDPRGHMLKAELYVNVSKVFPQIREIASCYSSHWNENLINYFLDFKRLFGRRCWCDYAEGFMTPVPLVNERWERKAEVGRLLIDL